MSRILAVASLVTALWPGLALAQDKQPPQNDRPATTAPEPRYLPVVREELDHMGIQARCTTDSPKLGRCRYSFRSQSVGVTFDMVVEYSDESDTLYIWANRYLMVPAASANLNATLRRMMELNSEMLVGKLEWNAEQGETRMSAVVSTDSNFDRRAFRGTVRALHSLCERYFRELSAIARGENPGR